MDSENLLHLSIALPHLLGDRCFNCCRQSVFKLQRFFFRCGLRGAYIEVVGFSKDVLAQLKRYLSPPHNASSTAGQVFPRSYQLGSKGWRSGESARLPPMWPRFKSRRRRHMWVEFVVGSLLCSERFFFRYSGFPLSSKTKISKFQFDQESGRRRTTL